MTTEQAKEEQKEEQRRKIPSLVTLFERRTKGRTEEEEPVLSHLVSENFNQSRPRSGVLARRAGCPYGRWP
jgi:hypothetical protein